MGLFPSCDIIGPPPLGVVPVLVGPLQALFAILPGLLLALGGLILALFTPSGMKKFLLFLWSQIIAVVIFLAIVLGLIFVPSWLPRSGGEVSEVTTGVDWPLWRGSVSRRGAALDVEDPAQGGINWRFEDGGIKTFYASPAVVGNRIYVTSARYEIFTDRGAVYSIDADTGKPVWKFDADGYRATFSSPSISGRYLVVGEGLHQTQDSRVFCLDLERSEKERRGVVVWQFRTGSHVESSPCIADGVVCIGAGDDGLYCFKLEPGADGKPVVLWHLDPKKYPDCEASPVIHKGKVYFSLGNAGQAVCCVDAADGKELWRVKTPYPAFGSPAILDGKLFVGMGTGNYVQSAEDVKAAVRTEMSREGRSEAEIEAAVKGLDPVGEVWCIDLETHEVSWKYPVGRTILGAPAAADGRVYFGSRDHHLYCVSTDGRLIDKWNARDPIVTSPAVGADHVYVVTQTGRLHALNRKSFKPVWEVDLNTDTMSSPAVARGHVYVGTTGAGLVCVGEPAGVEKEKPIWSGHLGGPGRSGWADTTPLAARGRFAWRYPTPAEDAADQESVTVLAPGAHLDGALYVGLNAKGRAGLAKLQLADDPSRQPTESWFAPTDNPVSLSAAVTERAVYFVDGRKGDANRKLRCLDAQTGKLRWSRNVAKDASGEFVMTHRGEVLIADRPDGLSRRWQPMSRSLDDWSQTVGSVVGMPLVIGDIVVVAVDAKPALIALDLWTGRMLWQKALQAAPRTGPVFAGDRIWVGGADGVTAYDIVNGERLDRAKTGPVGGVLVCDEEKLACVNEAGEVVLVNVKSGEETARIPNALPGRPPVLLDDAVLFLSKGGIERFELKSRETVNWFKTASWMGEVTSPMTVAGGQVYLATDKLGLVCVGSRGR